MRVKVGLVTFCSIPKACAMPLVSVVFPDPKSPDNVTTSPGCNWAPIFLPSACVSSGELVVIIMSLFVSERVQVYLLEAWLWLPARRRRGRELHGHQCLVVVSYPRLQLLFHREVW